MFIFLGGNVFLGIIHGTHLEDGGVDESSRRCLSFLFCPGVGSGSHSSKNSEYSMKFNGANGPTNPFGDGLAIGILLCIIITIIIVIYYDCFD